MDLILNINKPKGITSHDVVDIVRRKYGVKRVGHCGTLDPMATGVLIVLVGKETKRQSEFMGLEKEYVAEMALGFETDTGDLEGESKTNIIGDRKGSQLQYGKIGGACSPRCGFCEAGPAATSKKIEKILTSFVGEIEQEVPIYSAVKIKGKPLYKYAREGKFDEVVLPKRRVLIREIELLNTQLGNHTGTVPIVPRDSPEMSQTVVIRVVCSKGTYIRSLVRDIGRKLGCGATMVSLVRTRIGDFRIEKAVDLDEL